jgi:hypothetical protein
MKRFIHSFSLILVFSFFASIPCAIAQEAAAGACPSIRILSKNLTLSTLNVARCENCILGTAKVNRSEYTIVMKLIPNTACDETQVIPSGSTLKVNVRRIVRVDDRGACINVERGSFHNIGTWELRDPTGGILLFSGDVYRGTVGTNPQGANRCCNRQHEEVYIDGKGASSTTTGWYFRAMGVIQASHDLQTCRYSNWSGKLDGVISQE